MFRRRTKFVLTTILEIAIIPLLTSIVAGGTLTPFGPAWIVLAILVGGLVLILLSQEKRSAEESPSAFPTQKPRTRDVQAHPSVSSAPLKKETTLQTGYQAHTSLWQAALQPRLWRAVSQGLDGKDVQKRVRWNTAPSHWRVISLSSLSDFAWPLIGYGCGWGLVGLVGSVLLSCLSINVVDIADVIPSIHDGFFVKIGIARYTLPDWPVWIWIHLGAIGVAFGSIVGWVRREEKFLALLPDGFVHGNTGPGWISAVNFRHVAAIDVIPSHNALWITPRTSQGEKMSVTIPTDSDTLRSIVVAYEQFKASGSV
ncbi:hypothetical protein [Reticulibacter mediterranei]|uniref:hypothetical protein n=1 Tax=Reticulibacter mediterranei TaxID=2778369 RepID=UPI001C688EAB|nr:hypothetical protein [Reticulibacter mediterranei]